jgi:hypothetical protein
VRKGLMPLLLSTGMKPKLAGVLAKAGPVAAVSSPPACGLQSRPATSRRAHRRRRAAGPAAADHAQLLARSLGQLFGPAVLISIIGFVESVSVAQTLAARKRQRIDPDQELIGLGAANVGAAFTGGYPVTGGFARSVVNFDAGAETPAAGAYTAVGLLAGVMLLTPLIYFLPQGDAGRHHHRRGPVARGFLDPEEDLDLFARRFRRRQRHHPADPRFRRRGRRHRWRDAVDPSISTSRRARTWPWSAGCPAPSISATSSATRSRSTRPC